MVFMYCKCCHHLAGRHDAAANFYNDHFIPTGWELNYFKLSECLGVGLVGRCNECGGELEEIIELPKGLTGDDLLKAVYDTVQTARPYEVDLSRYGVGLERGEFYQRRDNRPQFRRSTEFLDRKSVV